MNVHLYFFQVILQLVCEKISFDKIIWGSLLAQNNEHGVMQPLAPDYLAEISNNPMGFRSTSK